MIFIRHAIFSLACNARISSAVLIISISEPISMVKQRQINRPTFQCFYVHNILSWRLIKQNFKIVV